MITTLGKPKKLPSPGSAVADFLTLSLTLKLTLTLLLTLTVSLLILDLILVMLTLVLSSGGGDDCFGYTGTAVPYFDA